jgi:hypothetical protein
MNAFNALPVLEKVIAQSAPMEEPSAWAFDGDPSSQTFGPLEWLIIAIGQRDGTSAFRSRPLLEAFGRLFAYHQPNRLANCQLEELRRVAALASEHGWHVPASEMAAFLRAGWSEGQLELLIEKVSPA